MSLCLYVFVCDPQIQTHTTLMLQPSAPAPAPAPNLSSPPEDPKDALLREFLKQIEDLKKQLGTEGEEG